MTDLSEGLPEMASDDVQHLVHSQMSTWALQHKQGMSSACGKWMSARRVADGIPYTGSKKPMCLDCEKETL